MYKAHLTVYFLKQLKQLLKKYPKLANDLTVQLENFKKELAVPLGHKLYKIRLKSSDLSKGKSKSFRLIIFIWEFKRILVPITIYFKGDLENISQQDIEYHLTRVLEEIGG